MPPSLASSSSSAKKPVPEKQPPKKARPYYDFITPALHRSFTGASALLIIACYVAAVWMGQSSLFWSWFPLGLAGVRTLLIFLSMLFVYLLRVSQLRFGARNPESPFGTVIRALVRPATYQALAWYNCSAWLYTQVYLFAQAEPANMGWTDSSNPKKLNERFILFSFLLNCVACYQATVHVYNDYDRIALPVKKTTANGTSPLESPWTQIANKLQEIIFVKAIPRAGMIASVSTLLYYMVFRSMLWRWVFRGISLLQELKGSEDYPVGVNGILTVFTRAWVHGCFLIFIWEFSNAAFTAYVGQEPLKNGKPLTTDAKDSNGSLIRGLSSPKELTKSFAFWELSLITARDPERRKAILNDIDRQPVSAWKSILHVCIVEINQMVANVAPHIANGPTEMPYSGNDPEEERKKEKEKRSKKDKEANTPKSLPKIAKPMSPGAEEIMSPSPKHTSFASSALSHFNNFAKQQGLSPPGAQPTATFGPAANQAKAEASSIVTKILDTTSNNLAHIPIFQSTLTQNPAARAARLAFVTPTFSNTVIDAADSVANLAARSLTEDRYGQVYKDIPVLVRTLVLAIKSLDTFQREFAGNQPGEVQLTLRALREALSRIIAAWAEHRDTLKLDSKEWRDAKDTAATPPAEVKERKKTNGAVKPSNSRKKSDRGPEMVQASGSGGLLSLSGGSTKTSPPRRRSGDGGSRSKRNSGGDDVDKDTASVTSNSSSGSKKSKSSWFSSSRTLKKTSAR